MSTNFGFSTTAEEVATVLASEIKDKNVLITGISPKSLGAETARVIAKFNGAGIVILAGRSRANLEQTEKDIKSETPGANLRLLILDLDSFAAVRKAADEVLAYPEPLHVLINNAGVMAIDYRKTVDGHEAQFGVNHLAHFLFTSRIFPKLREYNPRIVNVSSWGHRFGPVRFDDPGFSNGEKYDRWEAYGQSKTANILFSRELARRGVTSFSLHPGSIETNLAAAVPIEALIKLGVYNEKREPLNSERFPRKTLGEGTSTHIVAAFDPAIIPHSGSFLEDANVREDRVVPHATDMESARRLWELSEHLVGETFNVV